MFQLNTEQLITVLSKNTMHEFNVKKTSNNNASKGYSKSDNEIKFLVRPVCGIWHSVKTGLITFTLILLLSTVVKYISTLVTSNSQFQVNSTDLIFPIWGFIIFSFIAFANSNRLLFSSIRNL